MSDRRPAFSPGAVIDGRLLDRLRLNECLVRMVNDVVTCIRTDETHRAAGHDPNFPLRGRTRQELLAQMHH